MQLSALEHQKLTGGIDLNHLKRKNKKSPPKLRPFNPDDNNTFTDKELSKLANLVSPTANNLAPI